MGGVIRLSRKIYNGMPGASGEVGGYGRAADSSRDKGRNLLNFS